MIECPTVSKASIRHHYDLATPFYRLLWGPHIHHGLWEQECRASVAQVRLIDRLAEAVGLAAGEAVLDVGCGMGGTAIELARRHGCRVTGLTLSPVQRLWASLAAAWQGVGQRVRFLRADAESVALPPAAFDVVWNVECSEHLFDKPAFFRRAAGWLRPGGRVALCAWLAGDLPGAEGQVLAVCQGFLCPSLGTAEDYQRWLADAGLVNRGFLDLTGQVTRTWEVCMQRVRVCGVGWLARRLGGRGLRCFLDRFHTLWGAYRSGAMRYGLFTAELAE
jgi:tocopherol O-methyltransferase